MPKGKTATAGVHKKVMFVQSVEENKMFHTPREMCQPPRYVVRGDDMKSTGDKVREVRRREIQHERISRGTQR